MQINRLCLVYFSPTGTTKAILNELKDKFEIPVSEYDFTKYEGSEDKFIFSEEDFVIFGIPVYSGRVPDTMKQRMQQVTGNNTVCAVLATFGNRDYNDALLEMNDILKEKNFYVIGSAAIVTEHSVVNEIGANRPNEEDKKCYIHFAELLNEKLFLSREEIQQRKVIVPGNRPYCKYIKIPMAPKTNSLCNKCKLCMKNCPTGAICFKNKIVTDKSKCIGCMRCIKYCPSKARYIGRIKKSIARILLKTLCKEDKKSEVFIV